MNDRTTAKVVDITINQKNVEVRLNFESRGAFWSMLGAIISAPRWAKAVIPKPTEETFQIILHDQNSITTSDGNGVIDFQYLEIYDIDVTKNYSTIYIEEL